MAHATPCPDRICRIDEADFWSALRVPPTGDGRACLKEAIALGKAGQRAAAYGRLADYHRLLLKAEWEFHRNELLTKPLPGSTCYSQKPEDLLRNRINVWHSTIVPFGKEIDWNYNGTDKYGFHYLFWLAPGTKRFVETGDPRYRAFFIKTITSYYRARNSLTHPLGQHVVFYELGSWAKLNQLLPIYLALLHTGDIPVETHEAFMKLFLGFARSLHWLQRGYRPGNWQFVGCGALLTCARVFPEFEEAPTWEKRAIHYLMAHVRKDFYADGGHWERCWGYGSMCLRELVNVYKIAQRYGGLGRHDAPVLRRLRQAFQWFAKTLGPKELKPAYGDCSLYSGSTIIDMGQPFFPNAGRDLGVDRAASYYLKPSGYVIMRNGSAPDAAYLNLSFGPACCWHSHLDTLSLNFWAKGEPLLEEVGRFGGYGEALTLLFRQPESHNMLTVDGMHFDNRTRKHIGGHEPFFHSTPAADFFTAWHEAYRANPLEVQTLTIRIYRTVVFVKDPGYVLVHDTAQSLTSAGEGPAFSITQNWHSPSPFRVLSPGLARTKGQAACLLAFARPERLRRLEPGIDYAGAEAPKVERYSLRARLWMDVDHRGAFGITTILYPFTGKTPKVAVNALALKGALPYRADAFEVVTPRGRDVLVLNPEKRSGISLAGRKVRGHGLIRLGKGRGEVVVP